MAISYRRKNLADIIVKRVAEHLDEHPDDARVIALTAVRAYCYKLTYHKMQNVNWSLEYWLKGLDTEEVEIPTEIPV